MNLFLNQGKNCRFWIKASLLTVFLSSNTATADTSLPDWFVENEMDFSFATPASLTQPLMEPAPDLIVIEVDTTKMRTDIQILKISGPVGVIINNIGDAVAAPALVTVFEDTNRNGIFDDSTDNQLGSQTLPTNLFPAEEVTMKITVNGNIAFRGSPLYAMVDSDLNIAERNEDNNLNSSAMLCVIRPDIGTFEPVEKWAWSGSLVLPEHNQVMSTPMVAPLEDTNGDGLINELDVPSVVFNTFRGSKYREDGVLRAISGQDGHDLWTVSNPDYRTNPGRGVAIADIDGDSFVEIIAMKSGGGTIAFEHTGDLKWQSSANVGGNGSIVNLDGIGFPEIVFGRGVLNADGSLRWVGTAFGGKGISGVADINLDGKLEVIAGASAYSNSGEMLWRNDAVGDGYIAIGNFDADNYPEIVVVSAGKVFLLNYTGDIIWGPVSIPGGGNGGAPTIADMDGDGVPEIGIAGGNQYIALKADGSILWTANTRDNSSSQTGSSVFDFDGDGQAEVVYNDELKLRIYRGSNGTVLFETPNTSGTIVEIPLIVDVDNDNHADIVVCSNNYAFGGHTGIRVFQDKHNSWVNTRKIWNQHAYHITNINDDGTVPVVEQNSWDVHNTYRLNSMPDQSSTWLPDLTASLLRVVEASEGVVTITARIGNGGAIRSPAGVRVAFYDGVPDQGATLLGVVTIDSIEPNTYQNVALENVSGLQKVDLYTFVDDDEQVIECDETNNMVHDKILLATLADLTATTVKNGILLEWETLTEVNNAGFYLWRAKIGDRQYTEITWVPEQLIPAKGNSRNGASYSYQDSTVIHGNIYVYLLEDVDLNGDSTFHWKFIDLATW